MHAPNILTMPRSLCAFFLVTLASGCTAPSDPPAPQSDASFAAGYDDRDCNLHTPLEPGIPGSPGHLIRSRRNPNGESELAALMRAFVDDLQAARPQLERGEAVPRLFDAHKKLRCAWPTRPEQRDERYDALAIAYLHQVRAYDLAPGQQTYNGILAGCIACHSQGCGGPLDFIDGMIWR